MIGGFGDSAATGAAITVALCGSWQHELPCPLAPHHTSVVPGDAVIVRTVFAVDPAREGEVRVRIEAALAHGELRGPNGITTWQVLGSGPASIADSEAALAASLLDA